MLDLKLQLQIRADLAKGYSYRQIAERRKVSKSVVGLYANDSTHGFIHEQGSRSKLAVIDRAFLINRFKEFNFNAYCLYKDINLHPEQYGLANGFYVSKRSFYWYMDLIYTGERKALGKPKPNPFHVTSGQQVQIDFMSEDVMFVSGLSTVHFFELVYSYSRLSRVIVCPDMTQPSWLGSLCSILIEYGIPREILVDNDRSLIIYNDGNGNVKFNPTFSWLLDMLGTKGKACRPYSPKTKGRVERFGGYIKTNFLNSLAGNHVEIRDLAHLQQLLDKWLVDEADKRVFDGETVWERYQKEKDHLTFTSLTLNDLAFKYDSFRVSREGSVTVHGVEILIEEMSYWGNYVNVAVVASGEVRIFSTSGMTLYKGEIPVENLTNYRFKDDTALKAKQPKLKSKIHTSSNTKKYSKMSKSRQLDPAQLVSISNHKNAAKDDEMDVNDLHQALSFAFDEL